LLLKHLQFTNSSVEFVFANLPVTRPNTTMTYKTILLEIMIQQPLPQVNSGIVYKGSICTVLTLLCLCHQLSDQAV